MTKLIYIALTFACVLSSGICKVLPDLQYDSEFFNKLPLETVLQREESFSMPLNNLNQFLTDLQRKSRNGIPSGLLFNIDIPSRKTKLDAFKSLNGSQSSQGKRKRWIV
ncbi:uncharacterized protein LOC128166119 [Crassostrea angulata]|uniref:uncharacterized protein LOC128166119 n=1 Tax=Magallana angulata TaxID=2784310 RepID=UPI0022B0BB0A|nr:uncharacterized protein LOC128166119 [Crassostrea angulata]